LAEPYRLESDSYQGRFIVTAFSIARSTFLRIDPAHLRTLKVGAPPACAAAAEKLPEVFYNATLCMMPGGGRARQANFGNNNG
jgi:hypothetical protein